jgi:exodeoxyribonuclease VII small subunit
MADQQARKFEDELADLENVVAQIDSGELSLEESIAAFERGVGLVRTLNQKLDEVERRVEVLTRSGQGELRTAPYHQGERELHEAADGSAEDDDDSESGREDNLSVLEDIEAIKQFKATRTGG